MEREREPQVEEILSHIDARVKELIDPADIQETQMDRLIYDNNMVFELRLQSEESGIAPTYHIGAYIWRTNNPFASDTHQDEESSQQSCRHNPDFSVLYELEERIIHGFIAADPDELFTAMHIDNSDAKQLVGVMRSVSDQLSIVQQQDIDQSFKLSADGPAAEQFLEVANALLADGLLHTRKLKNIDLDKENGFTIETNDFGGSYEHMSDALLSMFPLVKARARIGEASYLYTKDRFGAVEIKTQPSDPLTRELPFAFNIMRDPETEKVVAFSVDVKKKQQHETEERQAGLYVPDMERADAILRTLNNL